MSAARDVQPRLLTLEMAAAYLSAPVARLRKLGIGRVSLGTTVRYDRLALDAWVDEQLGQQPQSEPQTPGSAEDALDRFLADQGHAAGAL